MTGIKLEKILDIDIYLFVEKGLRRGISYIAKRYSEANNKYMKMYDPTKPSKYISYLDMNNFYGWEMTRSLPYGGFEWLKNAEQTSTNRQEYWTDKQKCLYVAHNFRVNSISENILIGYILKLMYNILKNYMYCTMIIH